MAKRKKKNSLFTIVTILLGCIGIAILLFMLRQPADLRQRAASQIPVRTVSNDGDTTTDIWPKIVYDTTGNTHVVWDQKIEEYDEESDRIIEHGRGVFYKKGTGDPIQLANNCSSFGCLPAIAVAPNGTVMAIWSGPSQISYKTWQTNSQPPEESKTLGTQFGIGLQPEIAADSIGQFHIVANGDSKVKYCVWNGMQCTYFTAIGGYGSTTPEIAIDTQDNAHLIWFGDPGQTIHHAFHGAGSTTTDRESVGKGVHAQITADNRGDVHIVWSDNYNLHYCQKKLLEPCKIDQVIPDGRAVWPTIGSTKSGNIVIVYSTHTGQLLNVITKENDSWSSPRQLHQPGSIHADAAPRGNNQGIGVVFSSESDIQLATVPIEDKQADPPLPPCSTFDEHGSCVEVTSSIGLVSTLPEGFIPYMASLLLGLSGGIMILLIMYSGYLTMISQGDQEQLKKAKEIFVGAFIGIVFIIFSYVIFGVITIDILHLPGFTR